ncbi:lamin tail domain-containing protein, partial [Candidatus Latescibacterota bacterium]
DLTWALVRSPAWVTLSGGGRLEGTPPRGAAGTHPLVVELSDGELAVRGDLVLAVGRRPDLALTEILADPPPGLAGDANGDGQPHRYEDEFVELLNRGAEIDLSGWELSDDDASPTRRFRFPPGSVLSPGERLVLFGGGQPAGIPGLVFADDGRLGDGLRNGGDRLLLIATAPTDTLLDVTYSTPIADQSLIPVAGGEPIPHGELPGYTAYSPGTDRPTFEAFHIDSLEVIAGSTTVATLRGMAPGVDVAIEPGRVAWLSLDSQVVEVSVSGQIHARRRGSTCIVAWVAETPVAFGEVQVLPRKPPPNRPPQIDSAPDTLAFAGGNYRYPLAAHDPEGGILSFSLVRGPAWISLGRFDGVLSGRVPNHPGVVWEVAVEVNDGHRLDAQSFALRALPYPQVRIAEVLADPPAGLAGDANGDGVREAYGDEFVEIVNLGESPADLSGWELRDGNATGRGAFQFPAGSRLVPGERAVVFGSCGTHSEPLRFDGRGRIGDGLGNRRDVVLLVAPDGPDTVARVTYDLSSGGDESLCWLADSAGPVPHSTWPGRGPFSPGRPRPVLEGLYLQPSRLRRATGASADLGLVGRYSDGQQSTFPGAVLPPGWPGVVWTSSDTSVALVDGRGTVTTVAPGATEVVGRAGTLAANAVVEVRLPMAVRTSFSPGWESASLPEGRTIAFAVDVAGWPHVDYRWLVGGVPQPGARRALSLARRGPLPDTVQVQVRERRPAADHPQTLLRQWILRGNAAPEPLPLEDTIAWVGTPYRSLAQASDADGDRVVTYVVSGPEGLSVNLRTGVISWTPQPCHLGRSPITIGFSDGFDATAMKCTLDVRPPASRVVAATVPHQLDIHPNPFSICTSLRWFAPTSIEAELRIYNLAGQRLLTWMETGRAPGWRSLLWSGTDEEGRRLAAGVYFAALYARGAMVSSCRLVLVR